MDLNLTGQQAEWQDIAPKILQLKQLMDERKTIWDRLPIEKKKLWVQHSDTKDPIMYGFCLIIQYACENFSEIVEHYRG